MSTEDFPNVDVIIATHNRPELLRSALAAVWDQTYRGRITCVIVFDKAEPDLSLERTAEYRSVQVIRNSRVPGLAGARNSGILATGSELVAFCDDDDEWLPTKIERQVESLKDSSALTSVTGIVVMYGDKQVERVPNPVDMTVAQIIRNRVMEAHPSTVLVRRQALLHDIGLVDEDIPGSYGEDYDWIIRAAYAGRFAVVEAPLVKVRWGQSLFSRDWAVIIDAIDYLLRKHPAFREDPRALGRLYGRRAFALAALGRTREALSGSVLTLRTSSRERRALLAAAVALRLVSAERLMSEAHKRGRGI